MLCTQVAMFTYVPFLLNAPPFSLSTAALGLLFLTYLVGAAVTPLAGRGIDAYGHRAVLISALGLCAIGSLVTLVPSLAGDCRGSVDLRDRRVYRPGVPSSHVAHHAAHDRAPGDRDVRHRLLHRWKRRRVVPAAFWNTGGWPACIAFILTVELAMLAIAWRYWTPFGRENTDLTFQIAD